MVKTALEKELAWLKETLVFRIKQLQNLPVQKPKCPPINPSELYHMQLQKLTLLEQDRLVLIAALAPHLAPSFFDEVIQSEVKQAADFPEIGGIRGVSFRGFLPTGETVLFLLSENNIHAKLNVKTWLENSSKVWNDRAVFINPPQLGEPQYSGILQIDLDFLNILVFNKEAAPVFNLQFPAKKLETNLNWQDLILKQQTFQELLELKSWIEHRHLILEQWGLKSRVKPGYKTLFHGPAGTGKTLAATLLGKYTQTSVYRVDLSLVVSKYIGETEKNLSKLFDKAQDKNWILFFDEADAIFGKRTNVRDAHDKYANQEVSYLLQRIEDFNGLVILASNFKTNIDEAFLRRFQSVVYFAAPDYKERLKLWQTVWPKNLPTIDKEELNMLAQRYNLTGANIINVVQYACIKAAEGNRNFLKIQDLKHGIAKELKKEGTML